MKTVFETWGAEEEIPVQRFVKNRKLVKYFNRETAAAVVCAARLLEGVDLPAETPFYYETGVMEFESLGLPGIAQASLDEQGRFSQQNFVAQGAKTVPPLTQFKALYNMPLSFIAIERQLTGDNAVLYASARGLLDLALCAPGPMVLLGSGKTRADGSVQCGFALAGQDEIAAGLASGKWRSWLAEADSQDGEAIGLLRRWHEDHRADAP